MELRKYQSEISIKAAEILGRLGIVYLAMEVRTGKTLTALETARLIGARNVLFLTKKKAIGSIQKDYAALNPGYQITITNDESLHKIEPQEFDLLIHDEHHRIGAFPKPGAGCRALRENFSYLPHIYLSGTPTPESFSQIYHQFWISDRSPFKEPSFYKWAQEYVWVTKRQFAHGLVNDYSNGRWDKIEPLVAPYLINFTQAEAGFVAELKEQIITVPMSRGIETASAILMRDGVVKGQTGIISANNPAALQQKIHQLHSGTIILDPEEEGGKARSVILDTTKARKIAELWPTQKIVIFYQFCAELEAIKSVLGDRVTTDLEEWNSSNKSIALQVVSGREGINLSAGEAIVFYNISFSATSYLQARDRLTTSTRLESEIFWLMSDGGIERNIYRTVVNKKNYTLTHFKRDFKAVLSA
jgi:hypothetical protein